MKEKHPSPDIYTGKTVSLMKMNRVILMLQIRIIIFTCDICIFYVIGMFSYIYPPVVGEKHIYSNSTTEETSTYSSSRFCTVNCRPTASNYQLSHLRPCRESNPGLRGGRRERYHLLDLILLLPKQFIIEG